MAIGGVVLKKIAIIEDERGYLFEAIRSDDNHFMGFGQVYFVKCNPRSSRGGHYHLRHWDFLLLLHGAADLVLLDLRPGFACGDSERVYLQGDVPYAVVIPPLVWHRVDSVDERGFFAMGMPSLPHDKANEDTFRITYEEAVQMAGRNTLKDDLLDDAGIDSPDRRFAKLSGRDRG